MTKKIRVTDDIDIAIGFNDPAILIDGCGCDSSVGYVCEMCFTHSALSDAKRTIEGLLALCKDASADLDRILEQRDDLVRGTAFGDIDNVRLDLLLGSEQSRTAGWDE